VCTGGGRRAEIKSSAINIISNIITLMTSPQNNPLITLMPRLHNHHTILLQATMSDLVVVVVVVIA